MFHFKAPYAEKTPQPQTTSLIISCSESRDLTTDLAAASRLLFKPKETKHSLVHHVLNRTPIHCCKGAAQQFAGERKNEKKNQTNWKACFGFSCRELMRRSKPLCMFVKYEAGAKRRLASLRIITGKGKQLIRLRPPTGTSNVELLLGHRRAAVQYFSSHREADLFRTTPWLWFENRWKKHLTKNCGFGEIGQIHADLISCLFSIWLLKITLNKTEKKQQQQAQFGNTPVSRKKPEDSFFVIKLFCHRSVWHLKVQNVSLVSAALLPFVWNLVEWLSLRWTIWKMPQTSGHRREESSCVLVNINAGEFWRVVGIKCGCLQWQRLPLSCCCCCWRITLMMLLDVFITADGRYLWFHTAHKWPTERKCFPHRLLFYCFLTAALCGDSCTQSSFPGRARSRGPCCTSYNTSAAIIHPPALCTIYKYIYLHRNTVTVFIAV